MTQPTLDKWGNNPAVRRPEPTESRVGLDDPFRGKTPAAWGAAYADADDWGPDIGREVVPE